MAHTLNLKSQQSDEIQQKSPNDTAWQVYCVLRMWLASCLSTDSTKATLGLLLDALLKVDVDGVMLSERDPQNISLVPSKLDEVPIPGVWSEEGKCLFLYNLGVAIQLCWKKVGSLMGVPKSVLDIKEQEERQLSEQSYQMLLSWQKEKGREATYAVVFKATQRMCKHNPDLSMHAWCYCMRYLGLSCDQSDPGAPSIVAV